MPRVHVVRIRYSVENGRHRFRPARLIDWFKIYTPGEIQHLRLQTLLGVFTQPGVYESQFTIVDGHRKGSLGPVCGIRINRYASRRLP